MFTIGTGLFWSSPTRGVTSYAMWRWTQLNLRNPTYLNETEVAKFPVARGAPSLNKSSKPVYYNRITRNRAICRIFEENTTQKKRLRFQFAKRLRSSVFGQHERRSDHHQRRRPPLCHHGRHPHPGRRFNRDNFSLENHLKNHLSFGLRFSSTLINV